MQKELSLAREQIRFAREYTNLLLEDVADDEWFVCPHGAPSHLAWQMGHLAMAQYGLTMLRIRDKQPEDAQIITNDFMRCFKKGSNPSADSSQYPTIHEIRRVYDDVFTAAQREMEGYTEQQLTASVPMPYAVYANKLGSILFCPFHEMLHAGQIGLLRRMLGKDPLR